MSKTATTLLDHLLEQSDQSGSCQEHILEQCHYASQNVEQVMGEKFNQLVAEIENDLGNPQQNLQVFQEDGKKVPLPKWLQEALNVAGASRLLKVAYWKRETGYSYIMLKIDLDSRDRPNYYNLVLGSRRRIATNIRLDKLKQERPWWSFLFPGRH
ncbi:MAG: hypothetical protein K2W82_04460 [Candidatus Obscuribacterales bacterium]|jgi:hypothetical protein|nr:hypothetical protein [Candidatus Obscuribacterales bacterium]